MNTLSLYFQIRDDYLNLFSARYQQTKTYCEDLTEGKFSFPIICALHRSAGSGDSRLAHILRQRTNDVVIKKHAVEWMRRVGSAQYTRNTLRLLYSDLLDQIASHGGHEVLAALVHKLDSQIDEEGEEGLVNNHNSHPHPSSSSSSSNGYTATESLINPSPEQLVAIVETAQQQQHAMMSAV